MKLQLSTAQRSWLAALARRPGLRRPRGRTGYLCMHRGWTEWVMQHFETGQVMGHAEWNEAYPPGPLRQAAYEHWQIQGEQLTPLGRQILMEETVR